MPAGIYENDNYPASYKCGDDISRCRNGLYAIDFDIK